ncbi:GNAT family N-acetyltransferase [Streptomyces sp. JJ36]|uniref:GNAT family N-acetyltransferase n=1 Tax=Streptomyces sp. JJ36 TaxID=2736645 RepID=UPI001F360131|nr:GNAT family N-acetyltransferase [Streptomyces sp. JJ36]MCF6524173.1 GNAT family N-acetyltransferase [Streptomyces sp. JJ36]
MTSDPLAPRTLTPDDLPAWFRAVSTGFLRGPEVSPEEVEARTGAIDPDRTQGVFDEGRCVATFRTTPQQLTVPGGAALPSCAVTNVTVSPTHRRRGLLSRMTARALDAAVERGDAVSTLIAAEYPIYGRYGFGPAAWTAEYEVDVPRSGLDPRYAGPDPAAGRVTLADAAEVRRIGPELHDRFRAGAHRQGAIDRDARWWLRETGGLRFPEDGFRLPFFVVHRDAAGVPQGMAAYTSDDVWHGKRPHHTLTVRSLIAVTPEAERALWHYLLSVDWVTTVRSGLRPPDDLLPLLLPDPRAARPTAVADFLWLRPLDVPRMLEARTYPVPGTLVLDVRDPGGPADGRYRLEAGPDGATCTRTGRQGEAAGLTLTAGDLGTLFLGDESAQRLAELGRVAEDRTGAAGTADALFRTARRPWCPDVF